METPKINTKLNNYDFIRQAKSIDYWFRQYYLGNVTLDELIISLEDWDRYMKSKVDKNSDLWFKFSKDDTLATTISDLERDLNPTKSTKGNRTLMEEKIAMAVNENSLQIYFQ